MRHWNNTGKRGLALFLALLMCVNLLSLTAFAAEESAEDGGWYQDAATVKGEDAVCYFADGILHLKAGSGNSNGHTAADNDWPAVFINDEVSQAFANASAGETCYVDLTVAPNNSSQSSFGVFIDYATPGSAFVVALDYGYGGWYWEDLRGNAYYKINDRVQGPDENVETTLHLEWKDSQLIAATADGHPLFDNLPRTITPDTNGGELQFGIKCAGGAEITISKFNYGVKPAEKPVETTISGTVTANSNPVSGAVVTLEDASYIPVAGMEAVTTDENGAFTFEGVTETGCKVKVQADGYQVTTVDASTSAAVSVALEAETTGTKEGTGEFGTLETGVDNLPTWTNENGALNITFAAGGGENRANNNVVDKSLSFVNGEISFDVKPTSASRFGVTLRGTAGNNRIYMGQKNDTTWFWEYWNNGANSWDNIEATNLPIGLKNGVTRNVRVAINDQNIKVFIDGIQVYGATLPEGAPTNSGYAGFNAYASNSAEITNLRIVSFDSDEPTPPATYTLSGKVTGENGPAVSGATVTVGDKSTTTDASGMYSITGLGSGTYTVSVSAEGYTAQSAQVAVSGNTTKNWTLAQPDPTATYTVKGTVSYMPGNNSLAFWTIVVKQGDETIQTIEGGKKTSAFTIEGLKPGTYTLEVSSWNFQTKEETITVVDQDLDKVYIKLEKKTKDLECGVEPNTVFYELNGTELRIYGNGAMIDWAKVSSSYAYDDLSTVVPWDNTKLTKVTIEEGVTTVGSNTFKMGNESNLQSVSLPESLTKIGDNAFYHCYRLEEIAIPSTVTSIGGSAFYKCSGLGNVTLPAGLTEIADNVFNGCRAFTEITIPDGVTKIGKSAFAGCDKLAAVNWGKVKVIGESAFSGCALTSVVLPETVTILYDGAFYSSDLTSIVIPHDVALRNKVFERCFALENVVLLGEPHLKSTEKTGYGESSNSVFEGVYNNNPLFIYASGYAWMAKLAKMSKLGINTYYIANLDGGTLTGDFSTGTLATPEKEGFVFQGWQDAKGNGLTDATAKGTVFTAQWAEKDPEPEYIAQGECGKVEGTVFYGLTADGVLHIWGQGEMKDYDQRPGSGNWKNDPTQDKRAPWIAYNLAYTSVEIEEGVTSIGNYAFIPNTYAKPAQANLQSVTLPDSLTKIGQYAFFQSNLAGSIKIPDSVTTMGQNAFSQTQITSAVLSQGMTTVPRGTFSGCTNLSDVTIPNGVKTIVDYAFSECSSLTSITFPDTLTTINSSAFAETGLTSVTLPDSVKTLNNTAFWKNPNLESVDLGSVQTIGNQVFQDCPKLTTIELPSTLKSLGTAFRGTGITSITVPDGVELKSQAFDQMSVLRNIVLLGTPKLAGSNGGSFGWMSNMGENLIIYTNSSTLAEAVGAEAEIGLKFGYKPDVSDIFYYIANLDGGTLTADVAPGQLAPAEKEGFVFQGWTTADGTTLEKGEDGYSAIPAGTPRGTVYTAKWEEPKVFYTVTVDGKAHSVTQGDTLAGILPENPTKEYFDFIGWFNGADEVTANTVVAGNMTITSKWIAAKPAFNDHAYIWVYVYDNNNKYVCGGTIEDSNSPYITLSEVIDNQGGNSRAPAYSYPWQCTLTLHVNDLLKNYFGYQVKGYTWNGPADMTATLYCSAHGAWGTWIGSVGTNSTKAEFNLYLDKVERTGDVEVSVEPVGTLTAGENATFQVTVTNNTGMDTQFTGINVSIYDKTNDSSSYFSKAYDSNGNEIDLLSDGQQISIGDLPAGGSFMFTLEGTIPESVAWHEVSFLGQGWDHCWNDWQFGPQKNVTLTVQCGHEWSYVDNRDGTHSHICATCDHIIEAGLAHEFEDGKCVCGAVQTYTVTVDSEEHTVTHGSTLADILPENPVREGYTFQGWFNGEDEVTAETVVNGEMTITARWTAIPTSVTRYTLTISYVDESGSTVAPSHTQRLTSGSNYNVASPAVEGMDPDQAVVSGRLTRNTTVTVTYTANTSIEEPDVPLAELPLPFEDVKDGDWYREAVAYVWSNSLMLGTSDKLFGVETNTTRGMMSTMLYRLEKEPSVAFEKVFDDVDDGKWFSAAITWANAYGVVKGYDNGCFGPDDNVTREQLVTMLYRYATKKGLDVSKKADLSKFVDADKVSDYAKEAMSWAVSEGIIKGCGANDLAPTSQALRVEVATIFQRFAARYMTVETTA